MSSRLPVVFDIVIIFLYFEGILLFLPLDSEFALKKTMHLSVHSPCSFWISRKNAFCLERGEKVTK